MTTTELRLSGANLQLEPIVALLQAQGLAADVHVCTTTTRAGTREQGLQILLRGATRQQVLRLWYTVQASGAGLQCGHVKTEDGFSGCVHDLACGTRCPHTLAG
jgi:hypothetical protein